VRESDLIVARSRLEDSGGMNQPEVLDSDIRALQQWLRAAWQQLGDPSLTAFSRRELRNQMKQCSADLRARLQMAAEQQSGPVQQPIPACSQPELRILSW
jgi:hypothetical protein